jgi:transposase
VTLRRVLVELTMTEQRYRAVLEVQAGVPVTEVAERFGVSRQAVHRWVGWYRDEGLAGLAGRSSRPRSSPGQTAPEVEAAICELRRSHPRWGARRIEFELGRNGCPGRIPSRITIHRVLARHGLVDAVPRRRRREDYRRWQRAVPMELWQLDIVDGVQLADGPPWTRSGPSTTPIGRTSPWTWRSPPSGSRPGRPTSDCRCGYHPP